MNLVDLVSSIGWEGLGVIATIAAVVVALTANSIANKQFKKQLQIHEQSKSIFLYDQRVSILKKIIEEQEPTLIDFRLRFNQEIANMAQLYVESCRQLSRCQTQEDNFWVIFNNNTNISDQELKVIEDEMCVLRDKILSAKSQNLPCDKLMCEFRTLCDENIAIGTVQDNCEEIEINYYDIYEALPNAKRIQKEMRMALIERMEMYIEESMQSMV